MQINRAVLVLTMLVVLCVSMLFALKWGALSMHWQEFSQALLRCENADSTWQQIVWQLRMPRVLLALATGAALALAGALLQTLTRNPLADPYLFGVSSGAAFGVVLATSFLTFTSAWLLSISAFVGAMLSTSLLLFVTIRLRHAQVSVLVLCGVALSFLFSAMTSLLLYFSEPNAVASVVFWAMGSFANASYMGVFPLLMLLVVALGVVLLLRRHLNALLLGDEGAFTLGVNVRVMRVTLLLLCALLTAFCVAQAGGIGFVGLMIPHCVRAMIKQQGAPFYLLSALTGAVFMLWVDIAARTLMNNQELPVGVITAVVGSVFFFILLYWRQRQRFA